MPCPYSIGIDNEPRAREPGRNLVRPIGERHRDARMVDDLLELPPGRHAQRGEEPRRAPRRDCENHTFRLVRRSAGHGEPPATLRRGEGGYPLVHAHRAAQGGDERLDEVRHAAREGLEPLSELALPGDLDPEQLGRAPLPERLEPVPGPEHRSLGERAHQPIADAELACQVLDVALRGEEAVRTTLDDEAVPALRDDHVDSALLELPCGRQPGEPRAHHDAPHVHPRSAAAFRARPESASTSSGSSFRDAVRSSWTPSRAASARYVTSTSYRISTWSHTNPNGTMRNAR